MRIRNTASNGGQVREEAGLVARPARQHEGGAAGDGGAPLRPRHRRPRPIRVRESHAGPLTQFQGEIR